MVKTRGRELESCREGCMLRRAGKELIRQAKLQTKTKTFGEEPTMVEHEAKVEDDATNASKDAEDLNREVRIKDVRILSAKAETGAVRGTSAGELDSVRSDPEKSGTEAKALEDGGLGRFIAPGSKED